MQNFLELQRLVDDLVDFLGLSMLVDASLPELYYSMKQIGRKKHSVRLNFYHSFLKKPLRVT